MSASIIPFKSVVGAPGPVDAQPALSPSQAAGCPPSLSQAIKDVFRNITDRLKPSASLRMGGQAMIARPVRNACLIALPTQSSRSLSEGSSTVRYGFAEEDPLYPHKNTGKWRGSAPASPQVCGKHHAKFDPVGLADWLRRSFPQSTCHHIEARTGIPSATVENWLIRRSQPSVDHFARLIAVFGPELLSSCFAHPPGWIERAADGERARMLDAEIERLRRERAALTERRA